MTEPIKSTAFLWFYFSVWYKHTHSSTKREPNHLLRWNICHGSSKTWFDARNFIPWVCVIIRSMKRLGKPKCHRLYHWFQDPSMPQHLLSFSFSMIMLCQPGSFQTETQHTHKTWNSSYPCRKHLQKVMLPRHARMTSLYSISWWIMISRNGKRSFSSRFESSEKTPLSFVISTNFNKMPFCLHL